jgi:hypothetical protein
MKKYESYTTTSTWNSEEITEPEKEAPIVDISRTDDDIAKSLIKYLENHPVDETKYIHQDLYHDYGPRERWRYSINKERPQVINQIDPYGEEEWDEMKLKDIVIVIEKYRFGATSIKYSYNLIINSEQFDVSESLIKKIIDLFEFPERERLRLAIEERQKLKNQKKEVIRKNLFDENYLFKNYEAFISTNTWDKDLPDYDEDDEIKPYVKPEKPDDDIASFIIKCLEKLGVQERMRTYNSYSEPRGQRESWSYKLIIDNRVFSDLDPYGEEEWGGTTKTKELWFVIDKYVQEEIPYRMKINVPGRSYEFMEIDVSDELLDRIYYLLKQPERIKKEEAIRLEKERKSLVRKNLFENMKNFESFVTSSTWGADDTGWGDEEPVVKKKKNQNPDDDLAEIIIKKLKAGVSDNLIIKEFPPTQGFILPKYVWEYDMKKTAHSVDPYGEEEWGDDVKIVISYFLSKDGGVYVLVINERKFDVSQGLIYEMAELFQNKAKEWERRRRGITDEEEKAFKNSIIKNIK